MLYPKILKTDKQSVKKKKLQVSGYQPIKMTI